MAAGAPLPRLGQEKRSSCSKAAQFVASQSRKGERYHPTYGCLSPFRVVAVTLTPATLRSSWPMDQPYCAGRRPWGSGSSTHRNLDLFRAAEAHPFRHLRSPKPNECCANPPAVSPRALSLPPFDERITNAFWHLFQAMPSSIPAAHRGEGNSSAGGVAAPVLVKQAFRQHGVRFGVRPRVGIRRIPERGTMRPIRQGAVSAAGPPTLVLDGASVAKVGCVRRDWPAAIAL